MRECRTFTVTGEPMVDTAIAIVLFAILAGLSVMTIVMVLFQLWREFRDSPEGQGR